MIQRSKSHKHRSCNKPRPFIKRRLRVWHFSACAYALDDRTAGKFGGKELGTEMKLQAVVVGLLLPVLFSTSNGPSHTHWMVGTSTIARRSRWCISESQVVSCLDPHGSLTLTLTLTLTSTCSTSSNQESGSGSTYKPPDLSLMGRKLKMRFKVV